MLKRTKTKYILNQGETTQSLGSSLVVFFRSVFFVFLSLIYYIMDDVVDLFFFFQNIISLFFRYRGFFLHISEKQPMEKPNTHTHLLLPPFGHHHNLVTTHHSPGARESLFFITLNNLRQESGYTVFFFWRVKYLPPIRKVLAISFTQKEKYDISPLCVFYLVIVLLLLLFGLVHKNSIFSLQKQGLKRTIISFNIKSFAIKSTIKANDFPFPLHARFCSYFIRIALT